MNQLKANALQAVIDRFLSDNHMSSFFGLSLSQIEAALKSASISSAGVNVSPQFKSPGYGGNWSAMPMIVLSDLTNPMSVLCHESRHLLHYTVCKSLFESGNVLEGYELFVSTVVGDQAFFQFVLEKGADTQKQILGFSLSLIGYIGSMSDPAAKANVVTNFSHVFGALTYQHAYFVDPGICEAVASNGDFGFLAANDYYNRFVGNLIPGRQYLDGYKNEEYQLVFVAASQIGKAFFVTAADYMANIPLYWQNVKKEQVS